MPRVPLSVLDLATVREGHSSADALRGTIETARAADDLGYARFWVAEHHNMPAVASTSPPVLIAAVAAQTQRIRVGSGGVMLPNHMPFVVAEQFATLEALYPGRIDLGIGRAPSTCRRCWRCWATSGSTPGRPRGCAPRRSLRRTRRSGCWGLRRTERRWP